MTNSIPLDEDDNGTSGLDNARAARERMQEMHRQVDNQWPDVIETSSTLYELRKRNHFAQLIMSAMGGVDVKHGNT